MNNESMELLNQGKAYMSAENYPCAVESFRALTRAEPTDPAAFVHLGNALACAEDLDGALKAFKTALVHDAENGQILCSIAGTYLLKNDIASAVRFYNRAEAAGYKTLDMYLILAGIFAESEDYGQAIRAYSKAIELKPLRPELYSRKARLQLEMGMKGEALETLAALRELIPDAYDSYDISVHIHCASGEFDKAEAVAAEALERFPNDPLVMLLRLRILVDSGKYQEAVDYASEILALDTAGEVSAKAVMYKTTAHAFLGQPEAIIATFKAYPGLDNDSQSLYMLMNTCMMQRDFAGAKEAAEKLLKLDISDSVKASALFYGANAEAKLDPAKAEGEYRRILPQLRQLSLRSAANHEIYIFRLLAHVELREFDKAHKLADFLGNAYPELPDGHLYRSHIFAAEGKRAAAEAERKAALEIAPDLQLAPLPGGTNDV